MYGRPSTAGERCDESGCPWLKADPGVVGRVVGHPLADRIPTGSLVYVGWAGQNEAFDASLCGQMLLDKASADVVSQVTSFFRGALPAARPVLVPKNLLATPIIAVYDPPANAKARRIAVLMIDGAVMQMDRKTFEAELKKALDIGKAQADQMQAPR